MLNGCGGLPFSLVYPLDPWRGPSKSERMEVMFRNIGYNYSVGGVLRFIQAAMATLHSRSSSGNGFLVDIQRPKS